MRAARSGCSPRSRSPALLGGARGLRQGARRRSAGGGAAIASSPRSARRARSASPRGTRRASAAPTRSADAAAVARAVYPGLTPATRPQAVVLVDERDWPAALAASALAGAPLGAPLLYAEGDALPRGQPRRRSKRCTRSARPRSAAPR